MSNERIKKAGQTSSSEKDDGKSGSYGGTQFIPKSTSKIAVSVLSPHVAEFVPKSLALKKENPANGKESARCLEDQKTQEKALKDAKTAEVLLSKAVKGEHSIRGWWDEAPLKIEIDKTTNAPKPQHHIKELSERTHRPPRDNTKGYPWRQKPLSAKMDSNWRSRPSEKPKDIGTGFVRDRKETRKRNFHPDGGATEEKEHCSPHKAFGDRRFGAERRSGKDDSESALEVVDVRHQIREESMRVRPGRGRGRGRGRMAWMNDIQNQSSILRNDEPKDLKTSEQDNIKRVGRGHGLQSNNLSCSVMSQQTTKSGSILTSTKHRDLDSIRKEKEMVVSSTAEDDGWIVVGNKKKMDEEKDSGNKTKGKPGIEKSKEINEWDGTSSQQKLEKWKRNREQKKERKLDNTTDREGKTIQNKEKLTETITAKDSGKEAKPHIGTGKVSLKYSKDSGVQESIESNSKTNRKTQEKESKKLEFVKFIKTQQNSSQKEVKILLKRSNESKEAHEEQTLPKDSGFELHEGDDEFPDLAASSKAGSTSLASDWLSGGSRMPIISYSAVLKAMPKPKTQPTRNLPNEKGSSATPDKLDQNENEDQSRKKKKKKKKKKAKDNEAKTKQVPQEPKKTKQPMQFDLGDWLSSIEKSPPKTSKDKQSNPKKAVTIATGVLQIKVKDQPPATLRAPAVKATHCLTSTDKTRHNILDSTAPVIKRGKEREVPKKKKPSQLKRIILKEREEKRKTLEGEENQNDKPEHQSLAEDEGLSSEETSEEHKSEEKSSKEESVKVANQSKDDIITHNHGNTNDADVSSDGDQTVAPSEDDVKAHIHSRRFREYCDNVMDKELNNTTLQLIQKLVIFQDRQYHRDPVKSKAKRRFVVGLREVTKHLKLKKIKLVIISPNVERIKSAGGLDDTLHNIISIAHQNGVPVVFALRRQVLGRVLHKKVPVSAIGVFYYDGAEDEYKKLMDLTEKARDVYAQRWKVAYDELMERIQKERGEEVSRDVQEENSEIPSESKTEMKNDQVNKVSEDADKKSNLREIRKMGKDKEPECNRNQENEWENEEEMKDELWKQKPNISEERDDENVEGEKMELDERNEKKNKRKREEKMKDELWEQKEKISEESDDDDDLKTRNIECVKVELDERNEKENNWKMKEELKNELCDQNENISEESDDDDDLETRKIGSGKAELDKRNEKENEWDNDSHSVSIERDLKVEEL